MPFAVRQPMIVCSCNVFSDADVKIALASAPERPHMSGIYASLGCVARCGRCVQTIKSLIDDAARGASCTETCGSRGHHAPLVACA
jgi:bacterioferritin-associated ferredoxin